MNLAEYVLLKILLCNRQGLTTNEIIEKDKEVHGSSPNYIRNMLNVLIKSGLVSVIWEMPPLSPEGKRKMGDRSFKIHYITPKGEEEVALFVKRYFANPIFGD